MGATYSASRRISSDSPEAIASVVRAATDELHDILKNHGIEASFADIALLGHTESWDGEGQRWIHVYWPGDKAG
ncbi:hypothetical protein [Arthrobacter sp. 35W]|uniref:hypothetical protein n=1 Tax=Arthrobacter sp. 35W TaxID=1132441 RepID=UPI00047EAB6E|nr:hypothetical protein [Arthrobacter sp. 35W]